MSATMNNLLRALNYFRADASRLVLVFLLMLSGILLNVLKPWPLAIIVDSVLGTKALPRLLAQHSDNDDKPGLILILTLAILIIHIGQGALSAVQNFLSIKIGLRGLTRVRNEVFAKLQRLSLRFHQGSNSGDLIYRASWDTYAFQSLFQQGLVTFVTAFLSLVLMVAVMAQLNMRLTLVALAMVPLLAVAINFFGNKMGTRSATAQQADSKVTSVVQQSIAAMQLIQSYTREERERTDFATRVVEAERKRTAQHGAELWYWFAIAAVFGLGTAAIVFLGSREVLAGHLTIGQLLVFIAYLAQLYEPLNQLSHVGATVSSASAGTKRVFEILDAGEEIKDAPKVKSSAKVRGEIAFDNVVFAYQPDRPVLRGVSMALRAGESVAIVGPSGAGKTTLLNLLPRFFDVTSGSIKLDGIDLRDLPLRDLRSQIALVLQQPIILPMSVAENIRYAKPDASAEEIQAAARAANADEFIRRLPNQYDTVLGDGAARLSVGEQQRINLARAFLKNAPVLLLDEPTSALDADTEALVLQSLRELMRGRTTIIVAHRLGTIRNADKIVTLQDGVIAQSGNHEELLTAGGYYARLLANQSK